MSKIDFIKELVIFLISVPLVVFRLIDLKPDYFIYTHRKGWIHISKATEQDKKEKSGIMVGYLKF